MLWSLLMVGGSLYALRYENTPAQPHLVSDEWPPDSDLPLSTERPTLLMFLHPRCPCSRASLNELTVLMTRCKDRMDVEILFFKPPSVPDDWAQTDLWGTAARIPGVLPRIDLNGEEHRRFGAMASGETFLFQPSGELSFHGGITGGRGHMGDNAGRSALEAILVKGSSPGSVTPVFGCELNSPDSATHRSTRGADIVEEI